MRRLQTLTKRGFTLAEVLITLAVIGIVAALAIPALLQDTKNDQYKTAWKKSFAQLAAIHSRMKSENLIPFSNVNSMYAYFDDKVNYIKKCTYSINGCWHNANEWQNYGGIPMPYDLSGYGYILSDGSLMHLSYISSGDYTLNKTEICTGGIVMNIYVDVNGFKGPNKAGIDIFAANYLNDRAVPEGGPNTRTALYPGVYVGCDPDSTSDDITNGVGCSAKVLKE